MDRLRGCENKEKSSIKLFLKLWALAGSWPTQRLNKDSKSIRIGMCIISNGSRPREFSYMQTARSDCLTYQRCLLEHDSCCWSTVHFRSPDCNRVTTFFKVTPLPLSLTPRKSTGQIFTFTFVVAAEQKTFTMDLHSIKSSATDLQTELHFKSAPSDACPYNWACSLWRSFGCCGFASGLKPERKMFFCVFVLWSVVRLQTFLRLLKPVRFIRRSGDFVAKNLLRTCGEPAVSASETDCDFAELFVLGLVLLTLL